MNHQPNKHSLFPAYSAAPSSSSSVEKDIAQEKAQEWLINSSFAPETLTEVLQKQSSVPNLGNEVQDISDSKAKKRKVQNKKVSSNSRFPDKVFKKPPVLPSPVQRKGSEFFIDKKYDAENYSLGCLDFKTIPIHSTRSCPPLGTAAKDVHLFVSPKKKNKSKKWSRYFSKVAQKYANSIAKKIDPCQKNSLRLPDRLFFKTFPDEVTVDKEPITSFDGKSVTWKSHFNKSPVISNVAKEDEMEISNVSDLELMQKVTDFNRAVTATPRNEKVWLDFVDFQRELFHSSTFSKRGFFSESAMYDKQVSILDKALQHIPNSVCLTVTKLRILKNIQDKSEHLSQWENLIFYHPNNITAWQHYLAFILSDISYFDVSKVSHLFQKCLRTLSNILEGKMQSHLPSATLMQDTIRLFSAICRIFHGVGQTELALGLFQAQMEFNLFIPSSVLEIESCAEKIALFEPFWDSGVPRIGEPKAIGWNRTMSEKIITRNPEASVLGLEQSEDSILSQRLSECETWLAFETLRESNNWLPWRPDPDLDQEQSELDDLEREVTFEQVSKYLFEIREEKDKFLLLCEFFNFLGIPMHDTDCCFFRQSTQPLSVNENFHDIYVLMKDIFPKQKVPECLFLQKMTYVDCHAAFVANVYSQSIETFTQKYRKLLPFVWVRHKINNALVKVGIENCDKRLISSLKKEIKSILKHPDNRNCLFLWSEYIRLLRLTKDFDGAHQMFETLLLTTMNSDSCDVNISSDLCYFVTTYVKLCLEVKHLNVSGFDENTDVLLWVLSHVSRNVQYVPYNKEQKVSTIMLMKSSLGFKTILSQEMLKINVKEEFSCSCLDPCALSFLHCLSSAVYFQYLFQGFQSAMDLTCDTLKLIQDKMENDPCAFTRYIEEQIVVLQADVQHYHTWHSNASLVSLERFLCDAVQKYPGNIHLLSLLVKSRCTSPVVGPVRRFFYQLLKNYDDLPSVTWLFAIVLELLICSSINNAIVVSPVSKVSIEEVHENFQTKNCGMIWKIRSLFQSGLSKSDSRHSVALWRTFLKFEMTIGETEKAKAVFHQALQNCPWAKALYLDGIKYFPEDLRFILETMSEKQLRVHTLLEEIELLMNVSQQKDRSGDGAAEVL